MKLQPKELLNIIHLASKVQIYCIKIAPLRQGFFYAQKTLVKKKATFQTGKER